MARAHWLRASQASQASQEAIHPLFELGCHSQAVSACQVLHPKWQAPCSPLHSVFTIHFFYSSGIGRLKQSVPHVCSILPKHCSLILKLLQSIVVHHQSVFHQNIIVRYSNMTSNTLYDAIFISHTMSEKDLFCAKIMLPPSSTIHGKYGHLIISMSILNSIVLFANSFYCPAMYSVRC